MPIVVEPERHEKRTRRSFPFVPRVLRHAGLSAHPATPQAIPASASTSGTSAGGIGRSRISAGVTQRSSVA